MENCMNNWVEVGFQKFASFEPELTQLSHTVLDPITWTRCHNGTPPASTAGWRVWGGLHLFSLATTGGIAMIALMMELLRAVEKRGSPTWREGML